MLPAAHRVTDAASFKEAVRRGRRASSTTLVAHLVPETGAPTQQSHQEPVLTRAGFVVSKAVGNSVVRNRVRRRLRHLVRDRLEVLPGSSVLVVRALAPAAGASSTVLARDLDRCLARLTRTEAGASA